MNEQEILEALRRNGAAQYVTLADLIRANCWPEIDQGGVYVRVRQLPPGERPEDHGGFNAGGRVTWSSHEAAAAWAAHHLAYWKARQSLPYGQRGANW